MVIGDLLAANDEEVVWQKLDWRGLQSKEGTGKGSQKAAR